MPTYVLRDGELIEKDYAPPLTATGPRSHLPSPHFISDHMEATVHMADGRVFTSKKAFRDNTRAHGCIEVGDQKDYGKKRKSQPKLDKRQRKDDIRNAVNELKNGRKVI